MLRRILPAAVLALTGSALSAVPASATGPALLSIGDLRVAEPSWPTASAPADFTLTLDRPVDEPVTVDFTIADGWAVVGQSGTITFAPGEVRRTLTATVLRSSSTNDLSFAVVLSHITSAAFARPDGGTPATETAHGLVVNGDNTGSFMCSGRGAHELAAAYEGYVGLGGAGPSETQAQIYDDPCRNRTVDAGAWSVTYPGRGSVPPVTVTVSSPRVEETVLFERADGDNRAVAGDFAQVVASAGRITISSPGSTLVIDGAWSRVTGTCPAVDVAPTYADAGAVGTITLNGVPVHLVGNTISVPGASIAVNQGWRGSQAWVAGRSAVVVSLTYYSQDPYEVGGAELRLAESSLGISPHVPGGSPCQTHV